MRYQEQEAEKVKKYEEKMKNIEVDKVVYIDETGIDTYLYREYGRSPKGKKVFGKIRGRKYQRVGIVAAKMGHEIIAPFEYNETMNSDLFEGWFENILLPILPPESIIVMDNASFHRKNQLYELAEEYGINIIFLPPYSPEYNPIEHFWFWLKRKVCDFLPECSSLDDALFETFQVY